ncbi:MAG: DNA helicase Rep [Candidatus Competibacteraceae bacterium]|nr:DNA helicase Rep [Candidatus Competibacteraceae bacterium]
MDQLNPPQRQAVGHLDGPLLVLAGAGSGKTRVITHKIAYLIRHCGISARHIAAVTFTNKAAREMQERVGRLLEGREGRGLRVSTFHTLGLDIIRRELKTLGLRPGFSLYDPRDVTALLKELMHHEDQEAGEAAQWLISHWKNALVTPVEALAEAQDLQQAAAARAYGAYIEQMKAYNAVDFDDLILLPLQLLQSHPQILEAWQNRIRYLLVDEYQDTNAAQYQLVKALTGVRGALTAVGDDDQSIYAWRGAQPENLRLLTQDFPRLKVIKLEQNYRSYRRILKAANRLISHNPHVFDKSLWSELGHGDPIRVISCKSGDHEVERVVAEIIQHRFRSGGRYKDYAILYRSNHMSRPFEKALREHGIPYQLTGGKSFFEHTEIKDLLAYLRLVVNPDDNAAFLRIVNTPRREIGPATLNSLSDYAGRRGVSLLAACFELGLAQQLGERQRARLQDFARWIADLGERAVEGDPLAIARDLVSEVRYEVWLKDQADNPRAAERRINNVQELLDWLGRMGRDDQDPSLADRVAKLALIDLLQRNEQGDDWDAVRLMTLHGAKGLEFPHVFMIGLEEDLLPHRNSIDSGALEEERRLAYVGITRAQKSLTLTLARRRKRYGEWQECEPSRFLGELPEEDLEWEGGGEELPPEKRQERGRAHLAGLRDMLKA